MEKEHFTIGEASKYLQVSVDTLRRWDKTGKLRAERSSGGHRYYSRKDLQRFVLDLSLLGWTWASSAQAPDLPEEYYCERHDRFTSRLEKMGALLLQAGTVGEESASLLTVIAGEIGDNSFMHNVGNWPDVPGVFFAYDVNKRVIVLADRGRGIRTTLHRVRPDIETDIDALRVAFTEIVSGREPEKRGNGLKVVRRIVELNPIGLLFRSGIAMVKSETKPDPIKIRTAPGNICGAYAVITF